MSSLLHMADSGSRALSYLLGALSIGLAGAVFATSMAPTAIAQWTLEVFGVSFVALFSVLVFISLFAWVRMGQFVARKDFWLEVGLHGANGVSTLALTFTLLGISLGIGTLAEQELTPETVQPIIGDLTKHFSLAFLTTVVGLPSAAILRALLSISHQRLAEEERS
ncbi:conserved membrane hypothetical protein [Candidatus Terasakiella magnetica]|uniref:MotA/TolQ/ExbB proton channel domain-containing protein n=1 Tax=Candidatus Terasakiella magnetica TaxID=1867952 RepID=A0A1C3RLS5_9PROT|nr:hypothetical protein [Candidatus Terasakiella magnetica]SCA58262.1 conserved membrane hypothetical protein [Candidatus Terasakiella magnetica]